VAELYGNIEHIRIPADDFTPLDAVQRSLISRMRLNMPPET